MRLAVLADIHGSLSALEAVLHEIHSLGVDGLLVAGDMTCGPDSARVLQQLQAEKALMVLGNMDFLRYAYRKAAEAGQADCEYVPDEIWDAAAESFDCEYVPDEIWDAAAESFDWERKVA
jgi:predicted phosphodiesterase